MKRMFFPHFFVGALCISLFWGCSESDSAKDNGLSVPASTPLEAYSSLISAAESGDFGVMYDLMDSGARANWQIFAEVSRAQIDRLDSTEQAKWRALDGVKEMRDIFYRYASMTPAMWDHYRGGYQVLRVDTVVSIVTMQRDGQASVEYFRWENGAYRKTRSPEAYARPTVERIAPQAPPTTAPNSTTVPDANKR